MPSEMDALHEVFFEEAAELLADMENAFLTLETSPEDEELLNTIFRCVHSIKGAASMFGFTELSQFAHDFESVLDLMRHHQIAVAQPVIDLSLRASDMLKSLLAQIKGEGNADVGSREAIVAELQSLMTNQQPTPTSPYRSEPMQSPAFAVKARLYEIIYKPASDLFHKGVDPAEILERLALLGDVCDVQVDLSTLPPLTTLDPEVCYLGWTIQLCTTHDADTLEAIFEGAREGSVVRITEIGQATRGLSPASGGEGAPRFGEILRGDVEHISSGHQGEDVPRLGEILLQEQAIDPQDLDDALKKQKKLGEFLLEQGSLSPQQLNHALDTQQQLRHRQEVSSIRVHTAKVDQLINLVGELVITQSMVAQLVTRFTPDRLPQLEEAVTQMDRHARELQERVMAIRMVPIRMLFSRFSRVVRDLSQAQGKQVVLDISGEDTEIDKTVIEQIGDPLTHLVRNAIDHGIEPPAKRRQAGKPEVGRLHLKAYQQSGNIYIEVIDDGKGLDRDRIIAKAIQNGLVSPEQTLTEEEIFALIFRPGFSTAEKVTEVSGRGVGMDVVKRNVESLNGSITVQSTRGRGTTFKVKLPLTLAILDGQLLQVGGRSYVLPLMSIVESVRPRRQSLNHVFGEAETVTIRGQVLPLLRLHRLFGIVPRTADPTQGLVVIVEHHGRHIALFVDELLGQQQVVIKSLETNFTKVEGVAGATILGDGSVALILDVPGLLGLNHQAKTRGAKALTMLG
jgi:two-component system chemotaxis sensor kinase CheA